MRENIIQFCIASFLTVQVYYLGRVIYSIPMRYKEIKNVEDDFSGNFRGMHMQKHQRQPLLEQTKSGNSTA